MGRNRILFSVLSVLAIFIFTAFSFYNLNASQSPIVPQSKDEKILARSLYMQIKEDRLDDFVETLNIYPQYINIAYYHPIYKDFLTPLHLAVLFGRDKFIDELLKRKVEPSLPTLSKGDTIIHFSTIPHITRRFIGLELDLEALNKQNMTPLLVQASKTELNRDVIFTLLEAGVNVGARTDKNGWTALHLLFMRHHSNSHQGDLLMILQDMLKYGGRLKARDREGATPLHLAAGVNNVQAMQILVDRAQQIGIKDFIHIKDFRYENTPLFTAYTYQAKEAITYLLKLGANPLLLNKAGVSVNGEAHRVSQSGSLFGKFVLDEIQKYFKLPDSCVRLLVEESQALLHEQR